MQFLTWLKQNYINDNSIKGTLTRSLMDDPYIKSELHRYSRTIKRLKAVGASDSCIEAYKECWEEYNNCKKKKSNKN